MNIIHVSGKFLFLFFTILICSCNGYNKTQRLDNTKDSINLGNPVPELDPTVFIIYQDQKSNYWFGSKNNGVFYYDGKSLTQFTIKDGLIGNNLFGIQEDKFGNIYFDTSDGVSKFDGHKFTTLEVIKNNLIPNIWKLEPDDLWFRMGWDKNGAFRYDGQSLYFLEFPTNQRGDDFFEKNPTASFTPYGTYSMYKDQKGNMWFGTATVGFYRFDGKTISLLFEEQLQTTPNGGDFGMRSIIEDRNGKFWINNSHFSFDIAPTSTERNGVNYIDYKKENGIGFSDKNKKIFYPYFMSITEADNGDLWMVTYNNGVWKSDGKKLIHYPIKENGESVLLFSIYKDKQGTLWLGTHNRGVYKFDGKTFKKFIPTIS